MGHRELVGGLHPQVDRAGGEQAFGVEIRGDEGFGEDVPGPLEVLGRERREARVEHQPVLALVDVGLHPVPGELEGEVVGFFAGREQTGLQDQVAGPADVRLNAEGRVRDVLGSDVEGATLLVGLEPDVGPHAGISRAEHACSHGWTTDADPRPLV